MAGINDFKKSFGKKPEGERLERIKKSPNYSEGKFQNVQPTAVSPEDVSMITVLKDFVTRPKSVRPSAELPNIKTDLHNLSSENPAIVWFGHSSYFIDLNGYRVLVDPVFSGNASPVKFFGKSFPGADHYEVEDFPEIDLLILTHDHYDHLDYPTIIKLKNKVKKIVTSLGVASHLEYWELEKESITELDWWEDKRINAEVKVTAAPSRHFSGRGTTRFQTLWSSFILEFTEYKIFVGGDSGYSQQFKEIGRRFGPFDLAFLECGQYNENWSEIHMFPEQTVAAAKDLNAKVAIPVHWGKFTLSIHPWNEPIKRFVASAKKVGQHYVAPKVGEPYRLGEEYNQEVWWKFEGK
ncbi:MBL fold metallo-hydrolase [Autumnicola edwardsiae]|uniref:MBL fold metallo-hydrolase n=1 Tax=Autumnicola edwardsiae TaxID=3075594 RepID=A0ABU3CVK9_9FLAO|nr:MBL fold metallo-hydrolase [Zunongwangia sp. F297]MDT0650384.1 MBL fold metallo-hydrolase [Zunongwangia sp. F297]